MGAGPAGAAAAITPGPGRARRDGRRQGPLPRDKCCGDGLTTGALRLLEGLGLDPAAVASWQRVDDVVVRSPSGREATFPLPRGRGTYAAVARRTDLDAALVDLARAAGAKVLDGHACTGARRARRPRDVDVEGRRGTLHRPLAGGRRRHVVAGAQGASGLATPGLPGRVARLPPVLHRRRPAGARASCSCGSSPTCCPATPGRSRCRAGGPTSASASSGAARSAASRTWPRSGPSCSTGPTSASVLGAGADARGAPPGLAHPGPGRRGAAHRAAHPVRGRRRRRHRPA